MSAPYGDLGLGRTATQRDKLPGQVPNSEGAFSFPVDDWKRLDRFLILGSEGPTYYASARELTAENALVVARCVFVDGERTVKRIVEISTSGRAPKNDPALLALAMALKTGSPATKLAARAAVPAVARIGTHLFHLAQYVNLFGGWGHATTTAFSDWYLHQTPRVLARQLIKYQERDGMSHKRLLKLCHPRAADAADPEQHHALFSYVSKGWDSVGADPHTNEALVQIWAFERAKRMTAQADLRALVELIVKYELPHECVPNEMKKFPEVWEALLPGMGYEALARNLAKMTAVGLLAPLSAAALRVAEMLGDVDRLRRSKLHPLKILSALTVYAQGHGDKGSLKWEPVSVVRDALDGAFYTAFGNVEAAGRRHLLAVDVSPSMGAGTLSGTSLTPRTGAAVMALVTANLEPAHELRAFASSFCKIDISARATLAHVVQAMEAYRRQWEGTDCGLPMTWAMENKIPVDVFCVYTDSETHSGVVHPHIALERYRQKMGIGAKLVVVGMVSNGFTIANPDDGGMLDVVGFDTNAPNLIADFARQ